MYIWLSYTSAYKSRPGFLQFLNVPNVGVSIFYIQYTIQYVVQ